MDIGAHTYLRHTMFVSRQFEHTEVREFACDCVYSRKGVAGPATAKMSKRQFDHDATGAVQGTEPECLFLRRVCSGSRLSRLQYCTGMSCKSRVPSFPFPACPSFNTPLLFARLCRCVAHAVEPRNVGLPNLSVT